MNKPENKSMNLMKPALASTAAFTGYARCYADALCHRRADMRTGVILTVVGLAGCVASVERPPDPMAVLRSAAQTYKAPQSYYFVTRTEMTYAAGSAPVVMEQVIAGVRPSQFRQELDTPAGRVVEVSDGKTQWTYFPAAKEYVVSAAGEGPIPNLNESFLQSYRVLDTFLVKGARWVRAEELPLEGQPLLCDVVVVEKEAGIPRVPIPGGSDPRAQWLGVPVTYWIDRKEHRVLRSSITSSEGGTQETRFSIARVNVSVPSDLFTLQLPRDARQVSVGR